MVRLHPAGNDDDIMGIPSQRASQLLDWIVTHCFRLDRNIGHCDGRLNASFGVMKLLALVTERDGQKSAICASNVLVRSYMFPLYDVLVQPDFTHDFTQASHTARCHCEASQANLGSNGAVLRPSRAIGLSMVNGEEMKNPPNTHTSCMKHAASCRSLVVILSGAIAHWLLHPQIQSHR